MQDNKPTQIGLYWAKKDYSKDWDHIINIKGKPPFLNYTGWDLNYPFHESTRKNKLIGTNPTTFIFSNKISRHLDINKKIEVPKTPGLYWTFSTKYPEDFILAYIVGEPPYMLCFTWSIYSDLKKQVLNAGDLTYLMKIEKPEIIICNKTRIYTKNNEKK